MSLGSGSTSSDVLPSVAGRRRHLLRKEARRRWFREPARFPKAGVRLSAFPVCAVESCGEHDFRLLLESASAASFNFSHTSLAAGGGKGGAVAIRAE